MFRLIEWLIFNLPDRWYDEAHDTSWISWGGMLHATYWPLEYASVHILGLHKTWWAE